MQEYKQRHAWIKGRRSRRKFTRHARVRQQLLRYLLIVLILGLTGTFIYKTKWSLDSVNSGVQITGNIFTPEHKVKDIVSKFLAKPVLMIDPRKVEEEVMKLETIKYAFVRRYVVPSPQIVVNVKEEFPFATLVPYHGPKAEFVIAESGRLVPLRKFPGYPKPNLVFYANPQIKMTKQHVKQWGTWIAYIEKQTGEKVESVDLLNKFDAKVKTNKTNIRLGIPDTTLTQRMGRLTSVWKVVEQYRDQLDYIDLALDNNIPLKLLKDKKVASQPATNKDKKKLEAAL